MDDVLKFEDLYSWKNDNDQSVFIDSRNGILVYQNTIETSIHILDARDRSTIFKSNRFSVPLCESISLSPDRNFILYWFNDPMTIGICHLTNSDSDDILLDPLQYDDSIVLRVFWAEFNPSDISFIVVSNNRIDVFNLVLESLLLRTINRKFVSCTDAWNDMDGCYFVLLKHNQVLQPYKFLNKELISMPEVGLNLSYGYQIQHSEISIAKVYDSTYCIYKDVSNGIISLRSLSHNVHDKVIEVESKGWLEICIIDNLLLILTGSGDAHIFDIGLKSDYLIAKVFQRRPPISSISNDIEAFFPNFIVDFYGGFSYAVSIDYNAIALFLSRNFTEAMLAEFFQRRTSCTSHILDIVFQSIFNKIPISDMLVLFSATILPYSDVLVRINKARGTKPKNSAIPLKLINKYVENKSIVTEYNFATEVLYPYITKEWDFKHGINIFDYALVIICNNNGYNIKNILGAEGMTDSFPQIILDIVDPYRRPTDHYIVESLIVSGTFRTKYDELNSYFDSKSDTKLKDKNKTPYIITVILCYMKGLVLHKLYPSNILLLVLFDICILYNELNLVTYFLRSRIIRDSSYICYRLFFLSKVLNSDSIKQLAFDMALRLNIYDICVSIAISNKEYYKILLLLKNENVNTISLERILYSAANDIMEQQKRPYLWPLMISFIQSWIEENDLDPEKLNAPNLDGCQMWLPHAVL
ncbi:hypothetical protein BEWA_018590 [Theileria equi strain WA]|uniref:Mic1 domain-containing protein n=1 Tax=Theileria equi strain WA TaxID=1537102 RepID=L0AVU8_THEEQ|nr:hypothetical protein BEWA_018590 [Theileria equi strain WA]AFZ79014.1 hypothetical protein BEWA_018590 [Theileria equi strain WA]|eukprot:XP_004828680.1 hypothetical protein BEWA_018590 [Theileria equi strain WA]